MLIAIATGGGGDNARYQQLRAELLHHPIVGPILPDFVRKCRDLSHFWEHIKQAASTYADRRRILWDAFSPVLNRLEQIAGPADADIAQSLQILNTEHVARAWQIALQRRLGDPDGAITTARTLVESVCKTILNDLDEKYDDDADLPKLYHLTATKLRLAPSEHSEQVFRQILGGCKSVVEGLGSLRNKLGDAHGKGSRPIRPAPRHAELAVNLAGAMATFLVQTWEQRKSETAVKDATRE